MQVSAHGEAGFRRQQHDITGRAVRQKIDNPGRQYQFMQKRINRDEGIRVLNARKLDAFGVEKRLDYGRLPGSHDKRVVDIAGDQLFTGSLRRKPRQFADNTVKFGPFDYLQCQGAPTASLGTYRESSAPQPLCAFPNFTSTEKP